MIAERNLASEVSAKRKKFRPAVMVQQAMTEDPSRTRKSLRLAAMKKQRFEEDESRADSLKSLPRQGQMMRIATPEAAPIWSKTIQFLPQHLLKFALNAAHDTLPHNSNLHLWKKRPSSSCTLCHQPDQNMIHVLNNCKVALELRRYNVRHDQVLRSIASITREHLPPSTHMSVDLSDGYVFPNHIVATDQRPDMVWWNDQQKTITLVELTVCFETSYEEAITRKEDRYHDLITEAREAGYRANLITIEMGSRGLPNMAGFQRLRVALNLSTQEFRQLLTDAARQAITGSYKIWCSRNSTI